MGGLQMLKWKNDGRQLTGLDGTLLMCWSSWACCWATRWAACWNCGVRGWLYHGWAWIWAMLMRSRGFTTKILSSRSRHCRDSLLTLDLMCSESYQCWLTSCILQRISTRVSIAWRAFAAFPPSASVSTWTAAAFESQPFHETVSQTWLDFQRV